MKCEEFLAAQASVSRWQRWRASLHSRRCPRCAILARMSEELREELGQVAPLTPAVRQLWQEAALETVDSPRPEPASRWQRAALALAAIVLAAVTAGLIFLIGQQLGESDKKLAKSESGQGQSSPSPLASGKTIDASAELTDLLASVDALEAELQATRRRAELLDARKQADKLISTFSQW